MRNHKPLVSLGFPDGEQGALDSGAKDQICSQRPAGLDPQPLLSGAKAPPGFVGAVMWAVRWKGPPYPVPGAPSPLYPIEPTPTVLLGNRESYVRPSGRVPGLPMEL